MTQVSTVTVQGADEVKSYLEKIPTVLYDAARGAIAQATFDVQGAVQQRLRGGPMQSRSGQLGRSITPEVTGNTLPELVGRVYSTVKYARIHEFGGTVRAIDKYKWLPGGPYLNIPTQANKTPAGVMRRSATMVFAAGGKVMNGPQGFGLYLGMTRMFSFAKEVTIKPQLGMRQAAVDAVPPLLSRLDNLLQNGLDQ